MEATTTLIPTTQSLDFNFHITTPRLTISHMNTSTDKHCALFYNLCRTPLSLKYNPSGPSVMTDIPTIRKMMQDNEERTLKSGWGRFVVNLKPKTSDDSKGGVSGGGGGGGQDCGVDFQELEKDLVPIGVISMQQARHADIHSPLIPDVGFNMLTEFQGRGYAREAVQALMAWFRENKGVRQFAGFTDVHNEEAKRLLARLGFEDRGVRNVTGVGYGPGARGLELSVWTIRVGGSEEDLKAVGL